MQDVQDILKKVKVRLSRKQWGALKVLVDAVHTAIGYGWGAWWGKTYLWAIRVRLMCITYPGVRYAMVRDTVKNVKATTVKSLEKFYADYDISEDFRWRLNEQKSVIKFKNGSEIVLIEWCYYPSDPLYNRFGSLELTWAFIEESAECPIEGIEIIQTRVWRQLNEKYWILWKVLETFNPNPGHVYERYYQGKHKDGENAIFIPALVNENPFIGEQYVKNLERASEWIKRRLLYWEWKFDDNAWMLYKFDDIQSMHENIAHGDKYFLICDVARFGKDTTRISLRRGNNRFRVKTYEKSSVKETIQAITYFVEQYWIKRRDVVVDAVWVWWWVVDWLPDCTSFISNAKPVPTYAKNNYNNLRSQCAFYLQEKLQNKEIAVKWEHEQRDEDRRLLEQELMNTYIDEKSVDQKTSIEPKEKMKERIWRSPDLLDTLIMRMYPYLLGEKDSTDNDLNPITR